MYEISEISNSLCRYSVRQYILKGFCNKFRFLFSYCFN